MIVGQEALCRRFGWDYWTLMEQPVEFVEELAELMRAEGEIAAEEKRRQGAVAPAKPPPRSLNETLMAARLAGMPLPPELEGGFDV